MTGLELRICPGLTSLYRLALIDADDSFTTLSEHDDADSAIAAKRAAERASGDASDRLAGMIGRASA
jgi:hypothetical protein